MPRGQGHEQRGRQLGVVVQANELRPRSVVLVAPTSRSARPASFRPEIDLLGENTRVLVEQVVAIDAGRLGELVGRGAQNTARGARMLAQAQRWAARSGSELRCVIPGSWIRFVLDVAEVASTLEIYHSLDEALA